MSKKNVLLIGSEGYIGLNFQAMFKDDYNFICSDYELDNPIGDVDGIFEMIGPDTKLDAIVNLAAISGIQKCDDQPQDALEENANVPIVVHNFIKTYPKICEDTINIFASSQAVKIPVNFYAQTKMIGEYWTHKCPKGVSFRFSNVFGGLYYTEKKSSVVAEFIKAIGDNKPPIIHGNGEQERDFIHVYDVCNAINIAIQRKHLLRNKGYDISSGRLISIMDLANFILENTNHPHQILLDLNKNPGTSSNSTNPGEFSFDVGGWQIQYPIFQDKNYLK